jgi:Tol biopolymer transport system component
MLPFDILVYPDGKDLLVPAGPASAPLGLPASVALYKVNVASHAATKLAVVEGTPNQFTWGQPGKTVLASRTVNDVTNIWEYSLANGALRQVTFGAGADTSPMPDRSGKKLYFVTGRESGALTVYNTKTKQSFDVVSDSATQPVISFDGQRVNYLTLAGPQHQELWIADIDGGNKVKLMSSANLVTLAVSPDNSLVFFGDIVGDASKVYLVKSDGSGLRQVPWTGANIGWGMWSGDGKTLYFSGYVKDPARVGIWKSTEPYTSVEEVTENCGYVQDVSPDGKHLLSGNAPGGGLGIYDFSLADKKCTMLLPDLVTLDIKFASDGKSFLYLSASRGETVIYRQPWHDGKLSGPPQPATKVPFAFRQGFAGNAYDFSRDVSTIVYARPGGQADVYRVGQE